MTAVAAALRDAGLRRWVRPLLVSAAVVATIVLLAVSVFPTRTWLDQRAELDRLTTELEGLRAERATLEARIADLDTDARIEALARAEYGLVLPGEEAYAVLPAPPRSIELPPLWPFGQVFAQPTPDGG